MGVTDRDEVIKDGERAIAMLGEVEEPTPWCDFIRVSFENALALLREQEAVKPADHGAWGGKKCGACGTIFDWCVREDTTERRETDGYVLNRVRYCPWCGKKVKWDG